MCNRCSRKRGRVVGAIFKESVAEILPDLMKCLKRKIEELQDRKAV